jgi:hypothetical protein
VRKDGAVDVLKAGYECPAGYLRRLPFDCDLVQFNLDGLIAPFGCAKRAINFGRLHADGVGDGSARNGDRRHFQALGAAVQFVDLAEEDSDVFGGDLEGLADCIFVGHFHLHS